MAKNKGTEIQAQNNQVDVVPTVSPEVIETFKMIEAECKDIVNIESQTERFFVTARLTQQIQAAFDQPGVMDAFMQLQNSPLGFKTDQKSGYAPNVVRDALVAAFMYGVAPVGNQINIISGQCYVAKEGFKYKLKNDAKCIDAGLTGFRLDNFRFIRFSEETGTMVVSLDVHWTQNDKDYRHTLPEIHVIHAFATKSYRGGSLDQAFGKAERKAYAWLYAKITGDRIPDGDAAEAEEAGQYIETTAKEVEEEQPASDKTVAYLRKLINNQIFSDKAKSAIMERFNNLEGMTQKQAEQRVGAMLNKINKGGGKIPGEVQETSEASEAIDIEADVFQDAEPDGEPGDLSMTERSEFVKKIMTLGTEIHGGKWPQKKKEIMAIINPEKKTLSKFDREELETLYSVLEQSK